MWNSQYQLLFSPVIFHWDISFICLVGWVQEFSGNTERQSLRRPLLAATSHPCIGKSPSPPISPVTIASTSTSASVPSRSSPTPSSSSEVAVSRWVRSGSCSKAVGVSDGDTITVLRDHEQIKVRLMEIDAPEKG